VHSEKFLYCIVFIEGQMDKGIFAWYNSQATNTSGHEPVLFESTSCVVDRSGTQQSDNLSGIWIRWTGRVSSRLTWLQSVGVSMLMWLEPRQSWQCRPQLSVEKWLQRQSLNSGCGET
jgi:hypothetical protein